MAGAVWLAITLQTIFTEAVRILSLRTDDAEHAVEDHCGQLEANAQRLECKDKQYTSMIVDGRMLSCAELGNWCNTADVQDACPVTCGMPQSFCTPPQTNSAIARTMCRIQQDAIACIETAGHNLQSNKVDEILVTWFGQSSIAQKRQLLNGLAQLREALATVQFIYPSPHCNPGDYALVFPKSAAAANRQGGAVLHLCDKYDRAGDPVKLQTLFHEVSHLEPMHTIDVVVDGVKVYGFHGAKHLAKHNDGRAMTNAENVGYFVRYAGDCNH